VSGRPGPDFLAAMPRAFRDTLPSRLAAAAALSRRPAGAAGRLARSAGVGFAATQKPRRCLLPMLVRNVQQALDAKGFDVGR